MKEFHTTLPPGLSVEKRKGRHYLYTRVRIAGRLRGRYAHHRAKRHDPTQP